MTRRSRALQSIDGGRAAAPARTHGEPARRVRSRPTGQVIAFPRVGGSVSGFDGGTVGLRWRAPDHDLVGGVLLAALVAMPRIWIGDAFQFSLLLGPVTTLLGGLVALFALTILSDRGRRGAFGALFALVVGAGFMPALIGPAIVLALVILVWWDLR